MSSGASYYYYCKYKGIHFNDLRLTSLHLPVLETQNIFVFVVFSNSMDTNLVAYWERLLELQYTKDQMFGLKNVIRLLKKLDLYITEVLRL